MKKLIQFIKNLFSKKNLTLDPNSIEGVILTTLNTIIQFDIFPQYKLSEHSGLASLDHRVLPINFNWRSDGGVKSKLLTK